MALMMTGLVACDQKSPQAELKEQRMEASERFNEEIQESKKELNKTQHDTDQQRMEDSREYRQEMNEAAKKRNSKMREANEDYTEEVNE
jgi:hypothetical protein